MSESESRCIRKEPCPKCGSRDNLGRYDDGHAYCFGCAYYEPATGAAPRSEQPKEYARVSNMLRGEVRALVKRGITEETAQFWRYHVGEMNGRPVQIANYCDESGQPIAQKVRFPDKEFVFLGEPKRAGLYGQWLWRDGGKQLVITEGEIDALTVSQLQGNRWPVVSVPKGAKGAKKSIADNIEWIEKFDKVIFFFDDDDPGREAVQECAPLLTPGKAFVARIPGFKDANEAHQAGKGSAVIDAMWGAKAYRPDGVVSASDLLDMAFNPVVIGVPWPWAGMDKTYGIRTKEMYAFGGGVGCGKSDVFNEVATHLLNVTPDNIGMLKFEENPGHSTKLLAGKLLNKRLHVPGVTATPAEKELVKPFMDRAFLFDHFGAMDYDTVKERMRFMVLSLGCRYVFLDHLTALAAAMEDERRGIDKMMADLSAFTQQLDFTLFFVSHLATPEGKPHEEGGRVMEKHFRGSRAIAQWAHFMFGIERDKQQPDQPTTFRILKDRYTGDANGVTFGLAYDRETGRLSECDLPTEDTGFKDETGDF